MLQEHNTVVKTCQFSLTRAPRFSSLRGEKTGLPGFRMPRLLMVGRWFLGIGLGLALGACAAIERSEAENAKQEVAERARQRWDLMMKGQMDKAYEFMSPASRSTISFESFRKRNAAGRWWRSIDLAKVDCRQDTCQVTMALEYDLFEIKGLKTSVEETWIKDAGTWWFVAGK